MSRIGVFGGTFDPIHNGHLYVGENARLAYKLKEVVYIPSYIPPHKQEKVITDDLHRYEMCKLATKNNKYFTVSDIEIKKEDISYTYNTLKLLQEKSSDNDYYFIMGADMFADFPKWFKAKEIINEFKIIVFPRKGYNIHEILSMEFYNSYTANVNLLNLTPVNISGTGLRNQLRSGYSVKYLVPDEVIDYIKSNNIYRG